MICICNFSFCKVCILFAGLQVATDQSLWIVNYSARIPRHCYTLVITHQLSTALHWLPVQQRVIFWWLNVGGWSRRRCGGLDWWLNVGGWSRRRCGWLVTECMWLIQTQMWRTGLVTECRWLIQTQRWRTGNWMWVADPDADVEDWTGDWM